MILSSEPLIRAWHLLHHELVIALDSHRRNANDYERDRLIEQSTSHVELVLVSRLLTSVVYTKRTYWLCNGKLSRRSTQKLWGRPALTCDAGMLCQNGSPSLGSSASDPASSVAPGKAVEENQSA